MRCLIAAAVTLFPATPTLADCALPVTVSAAAARVPVVVDAPADGAQHLGRAAGGAATEITGLHNGYAAVTALPTADGDRVDGWLPAADLRIERAEVTGYAAPAADAPVVWQGPLAVSAILAIGECRNGWIALQLSGTVDPVWLPQD